MITLVLGGTRSGKSAVAERLAAALGDQVTYVATGWAGEGDAAMADRIARHQRRRPTGWRTVEVGHRPGELPAVLRRAEGPVLLDSLGTWLAAHDDLAVDAGALCAALQERPGDSVVVSEEVGLAVHPPTEAGRRFTDAIGELNQAVAAVAGDLLLVVAGRVLRLEATP